MAGFLLFTTGLFTFAGALQGEPRVRVSPGPGTTIQRTRPKAGFCFLRPDSPSNSFDYSPQAAHPFGASATRALFNASGVSPSPGTKYRTTIRLPSLSIFLIKPSDAQCLDLLIKPN
jgi:hypothetical protein